MEPSKLERRHEKSINDVNAIMMMIGERFDREHRQHSLGLAIFHRFLDY
jgi:hypothetical protein